MTPILQARPVVTARPVSGPAVAVRRVPARRRVRLTRRGRVALTLVAVVLLVVGFSVGRVSSQAAGPAVRVAPHTVTVHAGETLWDVARRAAPHVDPRLVVAAIEAHNHLRGATVEAGQQLVVPQQH